MGVSKSRVQRILKKHKVKPYKIKVVHHLHPGDSERRITFCRWYLNKVREDPDFGKRIIWSDESYISSAGIFNRQNTRYWSRENHYPIFTRQQQGRFGFSVCCFILDTQIKFHFFQGNLTGERYLNILNQILPELVDNCPLLYLPNIYFQQDGCPAHNSHLVKNYLDENFPGRWIGTHGPVKWPPRSPDLTILDFFLWGFLKNKIYQRQHQSLEELQAATKNAFQDLQQRLVVIVNAINHIKKRCRLCIRANGFNFEQYT